jgi:hypothetical protein
MAVFYQHIGERLWQRDAPKSIGTREAGLKRFHVSDIENHLSHLDPFERLSISETVNQYAPTGFQIWGIPHGAQGVLSSMSAGDYLLLLESTDFAYVGQVIHRVSEPSWDLSSHIWGEQRFPLIILLQGELINYPWEQFLSDFGFNPKYHMQGNTAKLGPQRIPDSSFETEEAFISHLLTTTGIRPWDQRNDFQVFANNLATHLRLVKDRANQQTFRLAVLQRQGVCCAVCDMSVSAAIEAAHVVPKEHNGSDDARNGIALCATHHRMFDANLFAIEPKNLSVHVTKNLSRKSLHITRTNISHLVGSPHKDAWNWRWGNFERFSENLHRNLAD